jgi:hypothetical protein
VDPAAPAPKPDETALAPAPKIDPATYDLKLADGFQVNEPVMAEFKTTAAELGLPPEGAQKLFDLYQKTVGELATQFASTQQAEFSAQQSKWTAELNAMPEFTGEARERNTAFLGRVMDEFGSPEAREYFNSTGAGNNPAIVKMILGMAEALMEGAPAPAARPANIAANSGRGQRRTGGAILYPEPGN